jgi:Ca2+-transporting ATPase
VPANALIHRTGVASAAVAVVLSPFPFADEIGLLPIYTELARRTGRRHGLAFFEVPWRPIANTVVKGLAARGVVNFGISFIPGVDAVVNAASAMALTEVLGVYMDEACAHPADARSLAFSHLLDALAPRRAAGRVRRVRLDVRGLLDDPDLARRVEARLQRVPGVTRAVANVRSGRVLVETTKAVAESIPEVERALAEITSPDVALPPSFGRVASSVVQRGRSVARFSLEAWRDLRRSEELPASEPTKAWHAMSAEQIAEELATDLVQGLTSANAKHRLAECGPNLLPGMKARSGLAILAGEVFTLPTAMLGGALGLSLVVGDFVEGSIIALVIGCNLTVGYLAEARAEELLTAWGRLRAERATVIRDGHCVTIAASAVVPGDILVLRAGDPVPADAHIIEADDVAADESTLTGESESVEKGPVTVPVATPVADRNNMVHTGTVLAKGHCTAVVCTTGFGTVLGSVQRALSRAAEQAAPLDRQLGQLGRTLAYSSLASAGFVTALSVMRGRPLTSLVRDAVALGVAALPEGYPTAGTTALALASRRLQKKGIIIRRLAAAETLGAVSVICADKTGTLTENRMQIAEIFLPGEGLLTVVWTNGTFTLQRDDASVLAVEAAHDLARIAALNADVEIDEQGRVGQGSGTERALVKFALAAGYPVQSRRLAARRIGEKRRSADSPVMLTMHQHPELGEIELAKGAPEQVVLQCSLDEAVRSTVLRCNDAMAARGLRVLALAWRREPGAPLEFAGLVGLSDPARPHVREAVNALRQAGIRILMLTGDQHRTAVAVAESLDIAPDSVHSRVTPEDKLDIVRKLQHEGSVVAMTGDGVNDGPALKAADVGIAMGKRGTDLARAVADVVLAEDDLPSLVEAVAEGRVLYDNIRRAIDYLVATNMSEVLVMLAGALFGTAPLSPLQLLWINLLTDVAPALALAAEPPDQGVMRREPRPPEASLFGQEDWVRLGRRAGVMAAGALAAYGAGRLRGRGEPEYAKTMAFTSLVTAQLLEANNYRARSTVRTSSVPKVLGASLFVQAVVLGSSQVRALLENALLGPFDFALAVGSGWWATKVGRFRDRGTRVDEVIGVAPAGLLPAA